MYEESLSNFANENPVAPEHTIDMTIKRQVQVRQYVNAFGFQK